MEGTEEVEEAKTSAAALYLGEEYAKSGMLIEDALEGIAEAERHAQMSLTDALAWVYLVESLTVTSTALIAGSITLYFVGADRSRPIGETRLRMRTRHT